MMKKPKILLVSDSPRIHSGFSRVAREVGKGLLATGKYEVAQHGWFDHLAVEPAPFPVFPTRPDARDGYGVLSFDEVAAKYQPDLVIGIGDPPFLKSIFYSSLRHRWKVIFYCPTDGFPLHRDWDPFLRFPDKLILFGEWSRKLTKKTFGIDCAATIPHGVDTEIFRPPSKEERAAARKKLFGSYDGFVFGFIGRNSERKKVDLVIQAVSLLRFGRYGYCNSCGFVPDPLDHFGEFIPVTACRRGCAGEIFTREKPAKVRLLLHTPLKENPQASVGQMVRSFGMEGEIYCDPTYKVTQGGKDEDLRELYWAMDCYLSFAMEGFGFPILEAMSCGTPIITGDYSAPVDWCREAAYLIPAETWITEQRAGLLRPIPDMGRFLAAATFAVGGGGRTPLLGKNGRAKAETMTWKAVLKDWEREVDALLAAEKVRAAPPAI